MNTEYLKGLSVGFTGTQLGMTVYQKEVVQMLLTSNLHSFHHGDCIGADDDAAKIAKAAGINLVICHPPIIQAKRAHSYATVWLPPKQYLARNHDIVDASDLLIVCPKGFKPEPRSGTWATFRYAQKKHKIIYLIHPDGNIFKH
jgi:hypothetical protein